ncbi:MAG: hypothetical protein KAY24_01810 [Candidatus Eisenbacteria sp.]|nr:hypothetical protein [Candidatus Eisenbacteria bacterium]
MEKSEVQRRQPTPPSDKPKFLRTGTFLHTSCPICGGDITEEEWICFKALGPHGEQGEMKLSARFNVFDKNSTIPLEAGTEMLDFQCPRCSASLIDPDRRCEVCESKALRVRISAVRVEVDLFVCTRVGCRWHAIPDEDRTRVILDNST